MIQSQLAARGLVAIFSLVILTACASASNAGGGGGNPDLLLAAEIPEGRFGNAFEAVQSLRPRWLRSRPNVSLSNESAIIVVYVDNIRRGGVEALESLSPDIVDQIEWIDATTATQRWGTGNSMGAIAVTTRRGG